MDNSTRRFGNPGNAPEPQTRRINSGDRPCLRCGAPMNSATVQTQSSGGGWEADPRPLRQQPLEVSIWTGKNWLGTPRFATVPCDALVCMRCGYVELAANPQMLNEQGE